MSLTPQQQRDIIEKESAWSISHSASLILPPSQD